MPRAPGDEGELAVGEADLLCGAGAFFCHGVLTLPPEVDVCRGKFNIERLTYILLLHTVRICRALSESPRSVVANLLRRVRLEHGPCDNALIER